MNAPRRLNLGCGRDHREGFLNIDSIDGIGADLVWDLNRTPYPLPEGQFDEILALDVVEHLEDVMRFMEESWRLLRPGGEIRITTPHFSSANSFRDPTHRWHLGYFSFDYLASDHALAHYTRARFEIVDRLVAFRPTRFNRLVGALARRNYRRWEDRWCWIFPAWFIEVRLRAVKPGSAPPEPGGE
jgi:SAM-dependent methyltransferase